jgi:hypothetical protein
LHTSTASSTACRGREVDLGRTPFLFEPRRADAELEAAVGEEIDRLRAARGGERVAQPDVVDVSAEPDPFGACREVSEVGERVVDRRGGRDRRVLLAGVGRAAHCAREHEVLGQPHRFVAEAFRFERRFLVEVRVERAERDPELHRSGRFTRPVRPR